MEDPDPHAKLLPSVLCLSNSVLSEQHPFPPKQWILGLGEASGGCSPWGRQGGEAEWGWRRPLAEARLLSRAAVTAVIWKDRCCPEWQLLTSAFQGSNTTTTCVCVISSTQNSHEAERRQSLSPRSLLVRKLRLEIGLFLNEWNYYLLTACYVPGCVHSGHISPNASFIPLNCSVS